MGRRRDKRNKEKEEKKELKGIEKLEKLEEEEEEKEKKHKKIKLIILVVLALSLIIGIWIKYYSDLSSGKREVTDFSKKINIWDKAAGNSDKSKLDDMNIDFDSSYFKSNGDLTGSIANTDFVDVEKKLDTYTYFHEIKNGHEKETYEDIPYIIPYFVDNSDSAIIVVPGGGYAHKTMDENDLESAEIAKTLQKNGINAFVLHYRSNPYEYPIPMLDLQRAVRYIRYHAESYGLDKNKIGAIGFSAGGNLILSYINLVMGNDMFPDGYQKNEIDKEDDTINGTAFIYPMMTFKYNVPMLFSLFNDEDVKNESRRNELLKQMDFANNKLNSKDIKQFVSYSIKDEIVGSGPREYVENAKKQGVDITVKSIGGQNHSYSQSFYMKEYIDWVKEMFKNK